MVTGSGDLEGYHLYAASGADGWRWRALATLQPGGAGDEQWIGQQCLTGDGRTVVAVVAPWGAANSGSGMDSGGFAYAVDAHTGAVRPLAAGVSLAYFDPGCGRGSEAVLTSYRGPDERQTAVAVLDAGTGRVVASTSIAGEATSAAWSAGRILAADGPSLVDLSGGRPKVLASFPADVAQIHAAADGGVDLVAQGSAASVWHWNGHAPVQVAAAADPAAAHIFGGADGRNVVTGVARVSGGSGLVAGADDPAVSAVSRSGRMALLPSPDGAKTSNPVTPLAAAGSTPSARTVRLSAQGGGDATVTLPAPAAARTVAVPSLRLTGAAATAGVVSPADATAYACLVPRADMFKQVMQPSADQIRWAVNQAVQGALAPPYTTVQRPVDSTPYTLNDAAYTPLPQAYADQDFPPVPGAPPVPPLVIYGILAQESNWNQASWHAAPGRAGDPNIPDYYGTGNSSGAPIDYASADCGYGIGQITDGMNRTKPPVLPSDVALRLAVDYATNIAAAVHILQTKWVELHQLGITMNDDDPTQVENWYAAIWAYNDGVHDDATGTGLGWSQNPANKMYPVRHTFLHVGTTSTPDDATHPNDWPYPERVFGWMEVPLAPGGVLDYRGTYDWDSQVGGFLSTPPPDQFCGDGVNACTPDLVGTKTDPCPSEDGQCYWNAPASWATCPQACVTDTVADAPNGHTYHTTPGDPEPVLATASASCSLAATNPGAGAIVVGDETGATPADNPQQRTPNLMGCPQTGSGLIPPASVNASFEIQDAQGDNALTNPASFGALDIHQLGGGLGGHLYFTHTGPGGTEPYEAKGVWQATLPADPARGTVYRVEAFVPDIAAATAHATYQVYNTAVAGYRAADPEMHTINQGDYTNQWADIGYYLCGGNSGESSCSMLVTARSTTPSDDPNQGADIAFNAVAFVPVPTGGYMAIGDSYSSGEGLLGGWDEGTDIQHNGPDGDNGNYCHRAAGAYPRLYAAAANVPVIQLACSGTDTCDLANVPDSVMRQSCSDQSNPSAAGSGFYAEPTAQIDLLRALAPRRVTLTIGGNDIGFAQIVQTCLTIAILQSPLACLNSFGGNPGGHDVVDQRIADLQQPMVATLTAVIRAVGDPSKVVLLTYPSPINTDVHTLCLDLTQPDRVWLRPKVNTLDNMLVKAAGLASLAVDPSGARKITVVDERHVLDGHEVCSSFPYVTGPDRVEIATHLGQFDPVEDNYYHPNIVGYAHMASFLASVVPAP
jgi:hypothetical protein